MKKRGNFFNITLAAMLVVGLISVGPVLSQGGMELLDEIKLYSRALSALLEGYVEVLEPRELFYKAVKGMIADLDRYSMFIDKEKYELLEIHMKGEYAGIGAALELIDDDVTVKELQPDSLAVKAGLKVADVIRAVDHMDVAGKSVSEVAAMIRGEADKPVLMQIFRPATGQMMDIEILRETIEIDSVMDVRMIGKRLGYFRISNFKENTIEQVDKALAELKKNGMRALIIDLRNNDGGLMPTALALAERFLPGGDKILSVKSRIPQQEKEYFSSGDYTVKDCKLVVLINERSASASEIFSAAMQDHKRAVIVGQKSFGKASVQSVVPLDEVTAIKLTTARYLSPNGRSIDQVGIVPDFEAVYREEGEERGDGQVSRAIELLSEYM